MRKFTSIIYFTLLILSLFPLQGCSESEVIGQKTMAKIISQFFLADQYINSNPEMMAQSDSMLVYPAIVEKFGYTMEDYNNSVEYYLQDGDEYSRIHDAAQQILEKRVEEIDFIFSGVIRMKEWWALDSIRVTTPKELMYDRYLRSAKWLIGVEYKETWTILDSAFVDIPQYGDWWQNNITPPNREYKSFMVKDEEEKGNEIIKKELTKSYNEKNSGKLLTPHKRRAD